MHSPRDGLSRSSWNRVSRLGRDHEPQSRQDSREMMVSSETTPVSAATFPRPDGPRSQRPFSFCGPEQGHQTDAVPQG